MQKKQLILTLSIFVVLAACSPVVSSPEQPSIETIVAGTLQALTSVPVEPTATAINGIPVTFSKLSFIIPDGLGSSGTEEKVEALLPAEGMPWWGIHPAYVQYSLQGYPLAEGLERVEINVYPIADYVAISEEMTPRVEILKSLINSPSQPLPERLPFLPTFNAGQKFHSNFATVSFQNGSGIRYLTEFSQFPSPIYNGSLIYTFQGITSDGLYYVSATFPISIGFLIGYPTPTNQGDFEFVQSEVERVTEQLNNSKPEAFTPSMLSLDAMIQSMTVTGIP